MPEAGFEPAISGSKRPQIKALGRVATGIRRFLFTETKNVEQNQHE
jgi:hypothetical protein